MTERSVTHSTFTLERVYEAAPKRVFHALTDSEAKLAWFKGPDDWVSESHRLDFRVGGHERSAGGPKDGPKHIFEATYHEIVPDERIVYTYDMFIDKVQLSVSLTSIELIPEGSGTRLVFTEHGAFLDGHEDPAMREHGTRELLNALGASLAESR